MGLKNKMKEHKELLLHFLKGSPRVLKYQIITKILFTLVIFPLFWKATTLLIHSKGVGAISNSQIGRFLMSPQGLLFLVVGSILLISGFLIEVYGFVIISTQLLHGKKESSYLELLKYNLRQFPKMIGPESLLLFVYLLVLTPLTGFGINLSFLKNIRIPNFITSVIHSNGLYRSLYFTMLGLMLILSLGMLFTFQFMVVGKQRPYRAIKNSNRLVRQNWKFLLKDYFFLMVVDMFLVGLAVFLWVLLIAASMEVIGAEGAAGKTFFIFLLFLQNMFLGLVAMLFVPLELYHLTEIFYKLVGRTPEFKDLANQYPQIAEKNNASWIDKLFLRKKWVVLMVVAATLLVSIPAGIFFDDIFLNRGDIAIVGHRGGGGNAIPENSLSSVKKTIALGGNYVEIDVQRTKDGAYILNHDSDFSRVAGDSRTAQEMTLEEIKKLDLGKNYPKYQREQVLTLQELMTYCKGKIGIYIELKGVSADTKMVDDVVKLIQQYKVENEVLLMSLDYKLIEYVRAKYPQLDTGYVYFLALGDSGSFDASHMIIEEDAASNNNLANIHIAGKSAVVWTVNKLEDMKKFAQRDVDAIITDDVDLLSETLKAIRLRSTKDILFDMIFEKS